LAFIYEGEGLFGKNKLKAKIDQGVLLELDDVATQFPIET